MENKVLGPEIYEKYGRFYIPLIYCNSGQIYYSLENEGTVFTSDNRLVYYNVVKYHDNFAVKGENIEFQSPLETKLGEALYG